MPVGISTRGVSILSMLEKTGRRAVKFVLSFDKGRVKSGGPASSVIAQPKAQTIQQAVGAAPGLAKAPIVGAHVLNEVKAADTQTKAAVPVQNAASQAKPDFAQTSKGVGDPTKIDVPANVTGGFSAEVMEAFDSALAKMRKEFTVDANKKPEAVVQHDKQNGENHTAKKASKADTLYSQRKLERTQSAPAMPTIKEVDETRLEAATLQRRHSDSDLNATNYEQGFMALDSAYAVALQSDNRNIDKYHLQAGDKFLSFAKKLALDDGFRKSAFISAEKAFKRSMILGSKEAMEKFYDLQENGLKVAGGSEEYLVAAYPAVGLTGKNLMAKIQYLARLDNKALKVVVSGTKLDLSEPLYFMMVQKLTANGTDFSAQDTTWWKNQHEVMANTGQITDALWSVYRFANAKKTSL